MEKEEINNNKIKDEKHLNKNDILINNNNNYNDNNNLELILKDIKQKNNTIDNLYKDNEILKKKNEEKNIFLNRQLSDIKEKNIKDINILKNDFEQQIKAIKEELIKNNKKENPKVNKEENKQRIEFKKIKEDINDLNDKFNNFERVFDNKLEFIETSLAKLIEKDEKEKKNENKINDINEKDNELNIDIENDYIWGNFKKKIYKIFSIQNNNKENIDQKDLDELKDISLNLMKNEPSPIEKFKEIFENNIINNVNYDDLINNLMNKKNKMFQFFYQLDLELNQKDMRKDNFNNGFNIEQFRKEYNLSEDDYSNEVILTKALQNEWNFPKTFLALIQGNN